MRFLIFFTNGLNLFVSDSPHMEPPTRPVMGVLLAPMKQTETSCLRITGRADVTNFATYHQLFNRTRWNPRLLAIDLLYFVMKRLSPKVLLSIKWRIQ